MWIFWSLLFIVLAALVTISVLVYRKFFIKQYDTSYFKWLKSFVYAHLAVTAVAVFLLIYFLFKPLWYTTKCWYDQYAYNVSTEYNWIKGQCLYTGKNGSKLPLWHTRDIPEGKDHSDPTLNPDGQP